MTKHLLLVLVLVLGSRIARAYENPLQFTAPGGASGLAVAGYSFDGDTVRGNCSYYTSLAGGGRGSRPSITYHYNECTWDLFGNLISTVPVSSEPQAPPLLSTSGFEEIYAVAGKSTTGLDKRGFGFVNTPTAHYSWETPNGSYAVIGDFEYLFAVILTSDGDFPLLISNADVAVTVSGTTTAKAGTVRVLGNTCGSSMPVGSSCAVFVSYNPRTMGCTTSPYGFAYTELHLSLVTDAGNNPSFKRGFTILGVPICSD